MALNNPLSELGAITGIFLTVGFEYFLAIFDRPIRGLITNP